MNPARPEHPGTGGGLRYLTEEPAAGMVNQERSHSCQAACARQLLKDAGVDISEADLLDRIGYIEGIGTVAERTALALSELHPRLNYVGGSISPNDLSILCTRDPWIASVRTQVGTVHAIIVDRLDGEIIHVRDPWGLDGPGSVSGTTATLRLSDFLDHWKGSYEDAVIPTRRK